MKYDVFLASANDDQAFAELIVRRLRSLKFKVRYDRKRTHTTPAPRDTRDINDSQSVLVLWSAAACDTANPESDWVHAMAHSARARRDVLLQVGLDETVPDEPFHLDDRYMIRGMTSRTTPEDFYRLVEELGRRDGRVGLREWLMIPTKDRAGQDEWRARHPRDPLAVKGEPVGVARSPTPAPGPAPAPATAPASAPSASPYVKPPVTSGAAALAASSAQRTGVPVPVQPPASPPPLAPPASWAATGSAATDAERTRPAGSTMGDGAPGAIGGASAAAASGSTTIAAPAAAAAFSYQETGDEPTRNPVWWILGLIGLLFLSAFLWRSLQAPRASGLPAVANAVRYATCPAGYAHRSLFTDDYLATLETGPVIDDTEQ